MKEKTLVVGATGLLGREVVNALSAEGGSVRALLRRPIVEAGPKYPGPKVDIAYGDLKNPDTLLPACEGVDIVVSTATATMSKQPGDSIETVDLTGNLNLLKAAETAGVKRFIFVSFSEFAEIFPLQTAKRTVESALIQSRIEEVVVRSPYFMEVWLSQALGFDSVANRATIYGSGENKISLVSVLDVARAIKMAVLENLKGVFEISDHEMLSPLEIVRQFEEIFGQPFAVDKVPVEVLRAQFAATTDPLAQSFLALTLEYARGHQRSDLEKGIRGYKTSKTLREFARAAFDKTRFQGKDLE